MNEEDKGVIVKLKKILVVSLLFMSVELVGGYVANSIAVLADAFHLLSDVLAYVISLIAVLLSYRKAGSSLTFGYEKAQPLGALLNVVVIWVVTIQLAWQATLRILDRSTVQQPLYMFLTSLFGLLCNLYIMSILHADQHHQCSHNHVSPQSPSQALQSRHQTHSPLHHHHHAQHCHAQHHHAQHHHAQHHHAQHNHGQHNHGQHNHGQHGQHLNQTSTIQSEQRHLQSDSPSQIVPHRFSNINIQAAYIHILTDIILSVGVIISASIIFFFASEEWNGWQLADPLCTYFFSIMAIYSTIPISKEAINFLIDGSAIDVAGIQKELLSVLGGNFYSGLKVWSTNRSKHYAALHVTRTASFDWHRVERIFTKRDIVSYIQLKNG